MASDIGTAGSALEAERRSHNVLYERHLASLPDVRGLDLEEYIATRCRAPHEGDHVYGLDNRIFLSRVRDELGQLQSGAAVLDYACGTGQVSTVIAQGGFSVSGFDLSDVGLQVALHHVVKYPRTAAELYRVMKPGSVALFSEGAAGNPLLRASRWFTIRQEVGDVPLSSKRVRLWARQFDTVQMQGIHFLYMIKRLGFGGIDASLQHGGPNAIGRSATFNALLRLLHRTDAALFNGVRMMLRLAGRYFIRLGK